MRQDPVRQRGDNVFGGNKADKNDGYVFLVGTFTDNTFKKNKCKGNDLGGSDVCDD